MRFALVLAAVIGIAAPARADDSGGRGADKGTFGVGLIVGEPIGVTAKLYLTDDRAVQGAVGSAFIGGGLQLHADYVFHPYILQSRDSFVLPVYVGPGVRVIDYNNGGNNTAWALGVRGVAGMLFDFKNEPLDVFFEIAPVLEYKFSSGAGFQLSLNVGVGIRYYF